MRPSSALLRDTPVRIADLDFPCRREHVRRTRLAYIHLDNLLHFAKRDRDGKINGYIAAWLPDETALLFLRRGELISAVAITETGRKVVPIAQVLDIMRRELERGELSYCEAETEQLAWMHASCADPARPRPVDPVNPGLLFDAVKTENYTGVIELISDGRVSYLRFVDGQFGNGYFTGMAEDESVARFVERQFAPREDGTRPAIAASGFSAAAYVPEQAPPALVESYRDLYWRVAEIAEEEVPDEALRRAAKIRDQVSGEYRGLALIGIPRDDDIPADIASPQELTDALGEWTKRLLGELEIIAPGVGPGVLKRATREHRYVLQKAGFYERLPWTVSW